MHYDKARRTRREFIVLMLSVAGFPKFTKRYEELREFDLIRRERKSESEGETDKQREREKAILPYRYRM